jgi:hypothetical protein
VELADRNGVLVATRVARVRMADPVLVHCDPEFLPRLVSMRAASSVSAVRPSGSSLPRVSCESLFVSSTVIVLMKSGSSARADAAPGSGFIAQNARASTAAGWFRGMSGRLAGQPGSEVRSIRGSARRTEAGVAACLRGRQWWNSYRCPDDDTR